MHFYGALILFVTVSAACGLTCHSCDGKGCTNNVTCPSNMDRCSSIEVNGVVTKSCMRRERCVAAIPTPCCSTDLCNGATHAASSILLLMASSGHRHALSLSYRY
uniref:ly-6/neurotoxin-like protein 1 isoform X1 n=1 Tax=Gasterosteus aculeatus aculeatus TaxID=481459 RepID=UPI001A99A837|nr:ly-6/neurotoxin-like protein 1 isoform X1 [Gasterosteus aculeatus aculeatus]